MIPIFQYFLDIRKPTDYGSCITDFSRAFTLRHALLYCPLLPIEPRQTCYVMFGDRGGLERAILDFECVRKLFPSASACKLPMPEQRGFWMF